MKSWKNFDASALSSDIQIFSEIISGIISTFLLLNLLKSEFDYLDCFNSMDPKGYPEDMHTDLAVHIFAR